MNFKALFHIFLSRYLLLGINFGLVVISSRFWGNEGRGHISLLITNIALVSFATQLFAGSSVSYFVPRSGVGKTIFHAYIGALGIGILLAALFFPFLGYIDCFFLLVISIFQAFFSAHTHIYIGLQKVEKFNWFLLFQVVLQLLILFIIIYLFPDSPPIFYFVSLGGSTIVIWLISGIGLFSKIRIEDCKWNTQLMLQMWSYGWKNQLSAFLQFLNYRTSYYMIELFTGIGSLGVYSVGVAISEAVWAISKSFSLVLYSQAIQQEEDELLIHKTKQSIKFSFWLTSFFIYILLIIPNSIYTWIFGKEFVEIKNIIFHLSLGILGIGVSNVVGHYFSGTHQLGVLNTKSLVGLMITIVFSFILIPKYGVLGACWATTLSYSVSSGILIHNFYQKTEFNIKDFGWKYKEIIKIMKKLLMKK